MEDTAQPVIPAAETDPVASAAAAFKAESIQRVPPAEEVPRQPDGRFASRQPAPAPAADEAQPDEGEAEAAAAAPEEGEDGSQAPDEGQPGEPEMPNFWPPEHAETWAELPAETQQLIAAREAQRDAAVNAKFQESANVRKAAEAIQAEAQAYRDNALAVTEAAIQLIQPQWPSPSMLDVTSIDYDPDQYHLQRANAEGMQGYVQQLMAQRDGLLAQNQQAGEMAEQQHAAAINQVTLPAFVEAYPEAIDQAKSKDFYSGLIKFAIDAGAPEDFFLTGPVTAIEWHLIADARKWRQHEAALKRVKDGRPAPRQAQPPVRPGVATPKSAVKATQRKQAMDRLAESGSLQDAAAVFKTFS